MDSEAKDGMLELGADVGTADIGALFWSELNIVSDGIDTGCRGGTFRGKLEAGKELDVKLEELVLFGAKE